MHYPLDAFSKIPPTVVCTYDYEPLARQQMGEASWIYFNSGGADEITMAANRHDFDSIKLHPRVLTSIKSVNTEVDVAGIRYPHPIFLAPVAYQKLANRHGEIASVIGASALKAPFVVSTQASIRLEDIAKNAETSLWFQLYVPSDRSTTLQLVRRAEAAGYEALVVTVDAPINGLRNAIQRVNFQVPSDMLGINTPIPTASQSLPELLALAPTWKDIEWLKHNTTLPLWLKGILHPMDALKAQEMGCSGVIISNHGGRVLDSVPSTISVLPKIREAVGPSYPLLIDGGIRRGTDILKAICLGANAVLIGRPYVNALSVAGALGVAHTINLLKSELEIAMALTGTPDLPSASPELIFSRA